MLKANQEWEGVEVKRKISRNPTWCPITLEDLNITPQKAFSQFFLLLYLGSIPLGNLIVPNFQFLGGDFRTFCAT